MDETLPNVGAPDPELKNSPIVDESEYDEQAASRDLELGAGLCYYNNETFPIGTYVRSGVEILKCTRPGVWVRKGEKEP